MISQYLQKYKINNKSAYRPVLYPEIDFHDEDSFFISVTGDRLDALSDEFYNTTDNWWVIAIANNLPKDTMYIEEGIQIRVPYDIDTINADFQRLNS